MDRKEIQPVNLKGTQPGTLVGRTDAEAEILVFWSPEANSQLSRKVPDAGKDGGQEERASGVRGLEDREACAVHGSQSWMRLRD